MCQNRIKSGLDMKGSGSGVGMGVLVYSRHKAD